MILPRIGWRLLVLSVLAASVVLGCDQAGTSNLSPVPAERRRGSRRHAPGIIGRRPAELHRARRPLWSGGRQHQRYGARQGDRAEPAGAGARLGRSTREILPAVRAAHAPARCPGARGRLRLHREPRWRHLHLRPCGGWCKPRDGQAHRPPRAPGRGSRRGPPLRRRRHQGRRQVSPDRAPGRPLEAAGRRVGGGHRVPVRLREHGHGRDRERQVALAPR
jgi:hypothetical protein